MKKVISLILAFCVVVAVLTFNTSAATTESIKIYNSKNEVINEFDIIVDNVNEDCRQYAQKAFDYINELPTSDEIYTLVFPKGNYSVCSSLNVYSNTTINLNGSTFYRKDNCAAIFRFGRGNEVAYGFNGYKNITFKNGIIDANRVGDTSLMRFAHAKNITLSNIIFKNTNSVHHQLTFAACDGVVIENCQFLDMDVSKLDSSYNCEAIQIDILKDRHFEYPAQDFTPTKNVLIKGCTFRNVPRGCGTHAGVAGYYFDNIDMISNVFENIEGYAIKTINYRNSEFNGNIIKNCGSGIAIGNMTSANYGNYYAPFRKSDGISTNSNLSIKNNQINLINTAYKNVAFGISVFGCKANNVKDLDGNYYSGDFRVSNVKIENNNISSSISKNNCYPIWINGAFGNYNSDKSNFTVKNNKLSFTNTNLSKNTLYGIKIENSSKIWSYNNYIADKKTNTFNLKSGFVLDKCNDISINTNSIFNTNGFGIKITASSNCNIIKNKLSNIGSNGIYIYTGCKYVNTSSNIISSTKGYGIAITDSLSCVINSNNVYSSKLNGIYLTGKSTLKSVNYNYIYNPKGNGIYLNKTALASNIYKNNIDLSSKGLTGIQVNDSASVYKINNNQINCKTGAKSKNLKAKCKNGITINSKKSNTTEIIANKIKYCDVNGISVYSVNKKPKITKNNIYSCKYGVYYCKGSVSKNTVKKSSKAKVKKI